MSKDYYLTLGITKDATDFEIKKSYRRLALKYHPDRNPDDSSTEYFKQITEAYGVLIDPVKRYRYDTQRKFSFNQSKVFDDILTRSDFRDVFEGLPIKKEWIERILNVSKIIAYEALVVGGTPKAILSRSMMRIASRGLNKMFHSVMDIHEIVKVTESIADKGGYITLVYRPSMIKRKIRVKIPENTKQGMLLKIGGMGRSNPAKISGDLYLHVDIEHS